MARATPPSLDDSVITPLADNDGDAHSGEWHDPITPLTPADQAALANAVEALEHTSLAARATDLLGKQIAFAGQFVPSAVSSVVTKASAIALKVALRVALQSLGEGKQADSRGLHRMMAAASGAAGGALGLASLPVELPISTTLMLRSIGDIARSEGEDLSDPATSLACLQVFALGGPANNPDALEGGYFAIRSLLAKTLSEAASYVAQKGVVDEAAPVFLRLIAMISGRFGLVVSQKAMAQAMPIVGAVGGAAINVAFIEHYQSLAKGHFTVRRLERKYSPAVVQREYERIAAISGKPRRAKVRPTDA